MFLGVSTTSSVFYLRLTGSSFLMTEQLYFCTVVFFRIGSESYLIYHFYEPLKTSSVLQVMHQDPTISTEEQNRAKQSNTSVLNSSTNFSKSLLFGFGSTLHFSLEHVWEAGAKEGFQRFLK